MEVQVGKRNPGAVAPVQECPDGPEDDRSEDEAAPARGDDGT